MSILFAPAFPSSARPGLVAPSARATRARTGTVGMGAFPPAAAAARGLCWRSVDDGGSRGYGDLGGGSAWLAGAWCLRHPASTAAAVLCLARRGAGADGGGARRAGGDGGLGAGGDAGVDGGTEDAGAIADHPSANKAGGDMEDAAVIADHPNANKAGGDMEDAAVIADHPNANKAGGFKWQLKWILLVHGTGAALITVTLLGGVLYAIYNKYGYDIVYGATKEFLLSYTKDDEIYAKVYSYLKTLILGYLADEDIMKNTSSAIKDITNGALPPLNPFPLVKKPLPRWSRSRRAFYCYFYLLAYWFLK